MPKASSVKLFLPCTIPKNIEIMFKLQKYNCNSRLTMAALTSNLSLI